LRGSVQPTLVDRIATIAKDRTRQWDRGISAASRWSARHQQQYPEVNQSVTVSGRDGPIASASIRKDLAVWSGGDEWIIGNFYTKKSQKIKRSYDKNAHRMLLFL